MTLVFDTSTLTTPELIIVPLVTLVVLAIGIFSIRYSRSFKKKVRDGILLEATGEIIDLNDHGDTSSPIIEFVAQNGKKYRHVSSISSSPAPKIGSIRTVYYDPSDPTKSYSGGDKFYLVFGLFFLVIGVVLAFSFLSAHIRIEGMM